MTHQEKEALLKRIFALPTEWADAGGSSRAWKQGAAMPLRTLLRLEDNAEAIR